MCVLAVQKEACFVWFLIGIAAILIACWPMAWIIQWLRIQSRIAGTRAATEKGVPAWIGGGFERLLAYGFVLFQADTTLTATVLIAWLGAKLAASWQRVPIGANDEAGRQIRAGTLSALIAGIISVLIGVLVGLAVRHACEGFSLELRPPGCLLSSMPAQWQLQ